MPAWQTGTQTKHWKQAGAQSNVYQCVHDARMSQRTSVCPHHILTALTSLTAWVQLCHSRLLAPLRPVHARSSLMQPCTSSSASTAATASAVDIGLCSPRPRLLAYRRLHA